jgi:Leucine-rich repeat (LRR) protein
MRHRISWKLGVWAVALMSALVWGCSKDRPTEADLSITFADTSLETVVRSNINKPTGDIFLSDVTELKSFDAHGSDIVNLNGIEYLIELTELNLGDNRISDLSPLSSLTNLTWLLLEGNPLGDMSALSGLNKLTVLYLSWCGLDDISALSSLTKLTTLHLSGNFQINDISPLSDLTELTKLLLDRNQISDLSPLSGLTKLTMLDLNTNQISDISPLVDNIGLASRDTVYLWNNPLNDEAISTQVPVLRARGVIVRTIDIFEKTYIED